MDARNVSFSFTCHCLLLTLRMHFFFELLAKQFGINSHSAYSTQIVSLKVCPRDRCPNKLQMARKRRRVTVMSVEVVTNRKINNLYHPPQPPPPCASTGSITLRTLEGTRASVHAGGSRHGNTRLKLVASVMLSWKVPETTTKKRAATRGDWVERWRREKFLRPPVSRRAPCDSIQVRWLKQISQRGGVHVSSYD